MKNRIYKLAQKAISTVLAAVMMLSFAQPAWAGLAESGTDAHLPLEKFLWKDSDGKYSCSYSEAQAGDEYMLFVVPGLYTDLQGTDRDSLVDNLLYINQKTAESGTVVFSGFIPSEETNSTVIISGTDLDPEILGYISHDYFTITGYSRNEDGTQPMEDSLLVSVNDSWEDVKGFLPDYGWVRFYGEFTGTLSVPVTISWPDMPQGFDSLKEGRIYRALGRVEIADNRMPASFAEQIGRIPVNITVMEENSIPVELTVSKEKTRYQLGEAFTTDDISIKAIYDDNTVRNISFADCTSNIDSLVPAQAGEYILEMTYSEKGFTATRQIALYITDGTEGATHKVTFDSRGGSYVPPQFVADGTLMDLPAIPEKNGYIFAGWSLKPDRMDYPDFTSPVTEDMLLYALWKDRTVSQLDTIEVALANYNIPLGSQLTAEDIHVTALYEDGSSQPVTAYTTDLDSIDQSTTGTKTLTVEYTEGYSSVEVTVQFRIIEDSDVKTATVYFDTGCETYIEPQTVLYNDYAQQPEEKPVKEGYAFGGWYLDSKKFDFAKTKITKDITLTARWSKQNLVASENGDFYIYTEDMGPYEYTGKKITPEPVVIDGSLNVLKKGTDYTIKYKNNTLPSTEETKAEITITAKGNYTGVITIPFEILHKDITEAEDVTVTVAKYNRYKAKGYTPVPAVKYGKTALKKGRDFEVYYFDEYGQWAERPLTAPGTYQIMVEGVGNYTGWATAEFRIGDSTAKDMKSASIKLDKAANSIYYTGSPVYVNDLITVTSNKQPLYEGYDYVLSYPENHTDPGKITVTVKAVENSSRVYGEKTFTFQIKGLAINSAKVTMKATKPVYGKETMADNIAAVEYKVTKANLPLFTAMGYDTAVNDMVQLEKGRDYTVAYSASENAGKATVEIKGRGLFTGTVKKTFSITKLPLTDESIECTVADSVLMNKKGAVPAVTVTHTTAAGTAQLKEGRDYTVKCSANKAAGTGKVTITGKGNYSGTVKDTFEITAKKLRSTDITVDIPNVVFGAKNKATFVYKPKFTVYDNGVKLAANKDYTVDYSGCLTQQQVLEGTKEGTLIIKAKGANYTEAIMVDYRVADIAISAKTIKFAVANREYTGKAITFDLENPLDAAKFTATQTMPDGTVKQLVPGQDFEIVSYKNNIKCGKATVTLKGIGDYAGTKAVTFRITKRPIS